MKFNTPILIILFNRPDLALKLLERLREIKPSKLYIAADGPREGREKDKELCAETRDIVKKIDWDCEVKTLFRDKNVGCGIGVSSAITWLFENEEYGIILEDDCLPDLSFFPFCEELLIRYKDDVTVFQISGTNFQNGTIRGIGSYYFSHYSGIWGWATWRRAWKFFNHEFDNLDETFKNGSLDNVFQSRFEKKFWHKKFKEAQDLSHNIWDNHWLYAVWKNKGIGIVPNSNLVLNLGFTNSGTHFFLKDSLREPNSTESVNFPLIHPPLITIEKDADKYIFNSIYSHSFFRILRLIKENGIYSFVKYFLLKI